MKLAACVVVVALATACQTTNSRSDWNLTKVYNQTVVAGTELRIEGFYHLNRDCSNFGLGRLNVVSQPASGKVRWQQEQGFPSYSASSEYVKCNNRRVPMTAVYYRPGPGFRGRDTVKFEMIWRDGDVWTYTINIEVR